MTTNRRWALLAGLLLAWQAHAIVMGPISGGGAEQDLLVNDLGLDANYSATEVLALTEVTLTVLTDGTWLITVGAGDFLGGSPISGTWLNGGSAADYQVRFTPSGQVNSPTITNCCAAYTAVSANRAFKVEKTNQNASSSVLVEIQRITNPPRTLSETTDMAADGGP